MIIIKNIANSTSRTFIAFCFCFILGVGFFSFSNTVGSKLYYLLIFSFVILFLAIIFWKNKIIRLILFCLLFTIAGSARFLTALPDITAVQVAGYYGREIKLVGGVSEEPVFKINRAEYVITTEQPQVGRILVKTPLYPQYNYGDRLDIFCRLDPPANYPTSRFDYAGYLANQGVYGICFNPKIKRTAIGAGSKLKGALLGLKQSIGEQINRFFPEPESSLLAGLLYGSRSGLSTELSENFRRTGLSHIVAVSGYNISIISVVFLNILIVLGWSRPKAFWLALAALATFVVFTGASASVVRAGIMGAMVLIAQKAGRLSHAGRLLLFAGAIILLSSPRLLVWDAGFQLSFLATLGLIYLAPLLWIGKNKATALFFGIANPTIAAIIATAPLVMFQFGQFSLVALPVNLLVVWLVPWLMLSGFLAILFGWLFYPLGQVIAWLAGFGLEYVIMIASRFAAQSWAAIELSLPWWGMAGIYILIIGWLIIKFNQKNPRYLINNVFNFKFLISNVKTIRSPADKIQIPALPDRKSRQVK